VRRTRFIAVVVAFLIGCAVVVLVVGCAGVRSQAPQEKQGHTEPTKQELGSSSEATAPEVDRCGETRSIDAHQGPYITNDVPGCPKSGLLRGTDGSDILYGGDGKDEVRGLGGSDELYGGFGEDVIYGGPGNDFVVGATTSHVDKLVAGTDKSNDVLYGGPGSDEMIGDVGDDVIYGGDGSDHGLSGGNGEDVIYGGDGDDYLEGAHDRGGRDKLYCGKGKDQYEADKNDYVSSSCEEKIKPSKGVI
jgi:hypothetical protein